MQIFTRLVLLMLLTTTAVLAQWSSDANVNLAVCDTSGSQELPKIVATSDGGCYVTWFDTRSGGYRVYMQRLNAQGVKLWDPNGLLISANAQNTSLVDYDLGVDDSNYAVVVFTDVRNGGQIEPFAYRISPQGSFVWGANGVSLSTSTTTFQPNPKVACTSDGNFVFAWIYTSTPRKIAMQKLNPAGVKQWGTDPILLAGTGTENLDYPALVPSDNGSVILMNSGYTGSFLNPGNYRIYTQKYSLTGMPLWGSVPDTVYGLGRVSGFFVPRLIPDGSNGAFYVWHDDRNNTGSSFSYVQHITSTDTKLFPANGAAGSTLAGRLHNDAWVSYTPANSETYMFWYETNSSTQSVYGVYGQKFSPTGARMWADSGVALKSLAPSTQPSFIRTFAKDSAAVVYYIELISGTNRLIKGFKTDRNGNLLWGGTIKDVSSISSDKGRLTGALTSAENSLLVWADNRLDGNGIYGQNVNFDGTLGNHITSLSGTYTVGATGNFTNLDSAFAALTNRGISGGVTLSLIDTVYLAPVLTQPAAMTVLRQRGRVDPLDAQIGGDARSNRIDESATEMSSTAVGRFTLRGPISGANPINRITIRPAVGKAVRSSGFNLVNASYVTIDGINLSGSTRLTINTGSGPILGTAAVFVEGNSDHNIIQNTTLRSSTARGVCLLADSLGGSPDSNIVQDNSIPSAIDGIAVIGKVNVMPDYNKLLRNLIGPSASFSDSLGQSGIYIERASNTVIESNYIQTVRPSSSDWSVAGIWVATKHVNTRISGNVVKNVRTSRNAPTPVSASGLYIFGLSTDITNGNYFNNMIYEIDNPSMIAGSTVRGIYVSTGQRDTIAFNSVFTAGTASSAITSAGLYASNHTQQVFRNNLIVNTRTETGTGRAIAFFKQSTTSTINSNFNDLYVPNQPLSYVAAENTTNYATLLDWRTTGQDSQSVTVLPSFRFPDLRIDSATISPINGGARSIAGIKADIDGQLRNLSRPDIGADEFTFIPPPNVGWHEQSSGTASYLIAVKAVSPVVAWAAGSTILKTDDRGFLWSSVGAPGLDGIQIIEAIDQRTAFIYRFSAVSASWFKRTTDGGLMWTDITESVNIMHGIRMFDATTGVAFGDIVNGRHLFIKTTNGGASWYTMPTSPFATGGWGGTTGSLVVTDTNHIWFGTNEGRVYRSTDGATTWSSTLAPVGSLLGLCFNDNQNGFAGGFNGGARTTDGGVTWQTVVNGFLSAVAGSGAGNFWYASSNTIYRSTTGGVSWSPSYSGTAGSVKNMSFATGAGYTSGWAVTDSGEIISFYGAVTGVPENQGTVPSTFGLSQNYPNPFNPSTAIRYTLPEAAEVSLNVYNLLGQRVAALTNETQLPGFYTEIWSGTNDGGLQVATGVYFYRLQAGSFVETKRMMLIK